MSILLTIHKIQLLSLFLCNTAMVKFTCTTRANKLEISRQTQKQCSHTGHVGDPEQTFTRDGFPGTQPACLKSVYITTHSQAPFLRPPEWWQYALLSPFSEELAFHVALRVPPRLYLNKGKSSSQSTHSWCRPKPDVEKVLRTFAFQQMKQPPGSGTGARIVQLSEPCMHSVPLEVTDQREGSAWSLMRRPALVILPSQGSKE